MLSGTGLLLLLFDLRGSKSSIISSDVESSLMRSSVSCDFYKQIHELLENDYPKKKIQTNDTKIELPCAEGTLKAVTA